MSFLDKLQSVVNLQYVLKAFGVIFLAISLFFAWKQVNWGVRLGFVVSPVMWFVGARFDKIYKS